MADENNVIPFVPGVQQVIDRVLDEARREHGGTAEQAGQAQIEAEFAGKLKRAKVKFTEDLRALYAFLRDPRAPAQGKIVAVGALLYFILPLDLVPDVIPIAGYLDDAAVITSAVAYLHAQLAGYRRVSRKRARRGTGSA